MLQKNWNDHGGKIIDSKNGFYVIECTKCNFKHIIPIPTEDELKKFYEDEFYSTEYPLYFEGQKQDIEWWDHVYQDRYDSFEDSLPQKQRRILDIGSGPGYFLLHGKKRGWKTTGIEPSRRAATYSRELGLSIIEIFFNEEGAQHLGTFDVIHMNQVLEHVPDPINLLKLSYNLLNPNGLICICVPNDYNPFQCILKDGCGYKPWWVAPPQHINYFNYKSLEMLMQRSGFSIILKESTFPIDIFLLMGDNYVGNDALGKKCHQKRKQFELLLRKGEKNNLRRRLYKYFADLEIGREMVIIGQKPSDDFK